MTTEFLWPYSWAWCRMGGEGDEGEPAEEGATPLCRTPGAAAAATDLLLALVHACVPNMAALANLLDQMFYSGTFYIFPPSGDQTLPHCADLIVGFMLIYIDSFLNDLKLKR